MSTLAQRAFELCVRKTRSNIKDLADKPGTWSNAIDGRYEKCEEGFFEIGNWTSSFFTGMAMLAWNATEDEYFLQHTLRLAPLYRQKAMERFLDMHHDAGFLYSLYSVGLYRLTKDPSHRQVGLAAAEALYQRFNHTGRFIRAWGRLNTPDYANIAIIDCMMNLPLLYWASQESSDPRFRTAAIEQADTTQCCFIRPDDSLFHAYRFDLKTGQPLGGENYCGRSVGSHWARGTAWAIYGFALSYRYTGDKKYLDAALRLARKFNRELGGDAIPPWDFRLSPGEKRLRDSSAAAVAVCAYQELERLDAADGLITKTKNRLLQHLCSNACLNSEEQCRGILRDGQVADDGPGSAKNAYTSWGDYFLMEALARELFNSPTSW